MMRSASRWLRRVEITLFVIGVSLLGVALGATLDRRNHQAEQERVLERRIADASRGTSEADASAASREAEKLLGELPPEGTGTHDPECPAEQIAGLPDELPSESAPAQQSADSGESSRASRDANDVTSDSDLLGRIEIPRIGLSTIVLAGDDDATLGRAVGWVSGTAPPGEGGNTALAGHRDTHFRPLQEIRIDDRIRLVVPPHTYEYRVESVRVVPPTEVSVLDSNGTEELTLVTCYPFRWVGPAPDRFIVKAKRIQ